MEEQEDRGRIYFIKYDDNNEFKMPCAYLKYIPRLKKVLEEQADASDRLHLDQIPGMSREAAFSFCVFVLGGGFFENEPRDSSVPAKSREYVRCFEAAEAFENNHYAVCVLIGYHEYLLSLDPSDLPRLWKFDFLKAVELAFEGFETKYAQRTETSLLGHLRASTVRWTLAHSDVVFGGGSGVELVDRVSPTFSTEVFSAPPSQYGLS